MKVEGHPGHGLDSPDHPAKQSRGANVEVFGQIRHLQNRRGRGVGRWAWLRTENNLLGQPIGRNDFSQRKRRVIELDPAVTRRMDPPRRLENRILRSTHFDGDRTSRVKRATRRDGRC